jgi:hypothetical protein
MPPPASQPASRAELETQRPRLAFPHTRLEKNGDEGDLGRLDPRLRYGSISTGS